MCVCTCEWQNMFTCVQIFQEAKGLSQMSQLGDIPMAVLHKICWEAPAY